MDAEDIKNLWDKFSPHEIVELINNAPLIASEWRDVGGIMCRTNAYHGAYNQEYVARILSPNADNFPANADKHTEIRLYWDWYIAHIADYKPDAAATCYLHGRCQTLKDAKKICNDSLKQLGWILL